MAERTKRYVAAGGVIVDGGRVLVLERPGRAEVRLPKGHVEPEETVRDAALREAREESGYSNLAIVADLGFQRVEFVHKGCHVIRVERYFLMSASKDSPVRESRGEAQFEPIWMGWDDALGSLTFEAEREWVRRARRAVTHGSTGPPQ